MGGGRSTRPARRRSRCWGARPDRDRERDEAFDYQGPHHKVVLVMVVPSAEKAYEELLLRDKNIPGGLRQDADGCLLFDTHDPDGVRIVFKQAAG